MFQNHNFSKHITQFPTINQFKVPSLSSYLVQPHFALQQQPNPTLNTTP
jgi:hypothetical protein